MANDKQELPLPPGVKLLRTLEGHKDAVRGVAFDPKGGTLASGSADGSVKLWETASGKLLRTLEGHQQGVLCVAFDPKGGKLASGSPDKSVKLWETASGKSLRTLEGHQQGVFCVAFDPQGGTLASGSADKSVKLWEAGSGKLLRTLKGHEHLVVCVAFNPQDGTLATGSYDQTVKLWDASSGKLLRTLEGHTEPVFDIAFSPDGRLLASKSRHGKIQLWSCETWEKLVVITEPVLTYGVVYGLAFHPKLPLLAAVGSNPGTPEKERSRLIHLWELDYDILLGRKLATSATKSETPRPRTVHSTTAKIVLVGDSGVGKTGLGWRLAHGDYREHDSSHGQQFWVLNQLAKTRKDGTQCEAVLWDLAGQPDYRLIHALSIQDADLAIILFDPTNSRDPLGSAEYWLRQIPTGCPKILVAARVDRGHPVLTSEELAAFCKRHGIVGGWIATSAREGTGLDELLERMKNAIPWDDKPAVSTDAVFKRIKDFVLALKESRSRKQIIFTAAELRSSLEKPPKRGLLKRLFAEPIGPLTDDQLLTAVRHLSTQGFVRLLTLSTGEQRILLVPELLNNLASSMVIEARGNPRGLGAVEESRLFDNSYRFRELEALSESDQALLIDGTITAFLANRLSYRCFRESWGTMNLLVFPDLMNLKKPERDDLATEDGPTYTLTGATENTFAGLVVGLGYTNLFLRTDQAKDATWFESNEKDVCAVRQVRSDQEHSFVLMFSGTASRRTRTVFEGLVEEALDRRGVAVRRLRPVACPHCGTPVDRAVMVRRLKQGKAAVGCEECAKPIDLPPDEPLSVKPAERAAISRERDVADVRTRFEKVIFELLRLAQDEKLAAPTCFISYAWGTPEHERWVEKRLATDLEKAGIPVTLDRWDNSFAGASIQRFIDRIAGVDRVLIVGTRAYLRKYENTDKDAVVAAEMEHISERLLGNQAEKESVIPLLLEGEPKESLPPALRTRVRSDFRNDDGYFGTALDLLLSLYRIPGRHKAATHWKQILSGGEMGRLNLKADAE